MVSGVLGDPKLQAIADRLQAQSVAQERATGAYFAQRIKAGDLSWEGFDDRLTAFMADKLVALEPIKAEFCHLMCRSLRARRIVGVEHLLWRLDAPSRRSGAGERRRHGDRDRARTGQGRRSAGPFRRSRPR